MCFVFFFLMIRRPPRSTRTEHSFPTRRSSDLPSSLRADTRVSMSPTPRTTTDASESSGASSDVKEAIPCCTSSKRSRSVHRSEEHTSELQSLMRISYAVFCLTKKTKYEILHTTKTETKYTIRSNKQTAQ